MFSSCTAAACCFLSAVELAVDGLPPPKTCRASKAEERFTAWHIEECRLGAGCDSEACVLAALVGRCPWAWLWESSKPR